MKNTFKSLIKTTGKVVFVIGLVLNICMIFFGMWPSLIYILLMLFGAGAVYITENYKTTNVTYPAIKKLLTIILISFFGVIAIITIVFFLSNDYRKNRDTLNECNEIVKGLKHYKASVNQYPTDLLILIKGDPLRSSWLQDEWQKPYIYNLTNNGNSYVLRSGGADKNIGTKDDLVFKGN